MQPFQVPASRSTVVQLAECKYGCGFWQDRIYIDQEDVYRAVKTEGSYPWTVLLPICAMYVQRRVVRASVEDSEEEVTSMKWSPCLSCLQISKTSEIPHVSHGVANFPVIDLLM